MQPVVVSRGRPRAFRTGRIRPQSEKMGRCCQLVAVPVSESSREAGYSRPQLAAFRDGPDIGNPLEPGVARRDVIETFEALSRAEVVAYAAIAGKACRSSDLNDHAAYPIAAGGRGFCHDCSPYSAMAATNAFGHQYPLLRKTAAQMNPLFQAACSGRVREFAICRLGLISIGAKPHTEVSGRSRFLRRA